LAARSAYRDAWLHFLEWSFLGYSHPENEFDKKTIIKEIKDKTEIKRKGRPEKTKTELRMMQERFSKLLTACKLIHHQAQEAKQHIGINGSGNITAIRRRLW
jgi:hypothetical protein